jgi:uncharacterized phage protein (TIGR02218 family)
MAFDTYEESQEGSRPIELYKFTTGASIKLYTSAEDDITESGDVYIAIPISRNKLNGGGPDQRDESLIITVETENEIAQLYINSVPGIFTEVEVSRVQRSDGPGYEVVQIFAGRIAAVAFRDKGRTAEINVAPLVSAVSRAIPRFNYQGLCNHVLYDDLCQIDDTDVAYRLSSAAVTAESGNTVTVSGVGAFGTNWFTGGFIETLGGVDRRLITASSGDVLTLLLPFAVTPVGSLAIVFAGCEHTIPVCKSKFNNVINYGGFAFVPTKNIFQTGITT